MPVPFLSQAQRCLRKGPPVRALSVSHQGQASPALSGRGCREGWMWWGVESTVASGHLCGLRMEAGGCLHGVLQAPRYLDDV